MIFPSSSPFPFLSSYSVLAIDTETRDLGLQQGLGSGWFNCNGEVLGISIAYRQSNTTKKYYFPIAHASGNLDKDKVVEFFKNLFATYTGTIVFHNAVYDIGWLGTLGIVPNKQMRIRDTGYAAALLDENRFSYRLDDLGKEELGVGKDYTLLERAMKRLGCRSMGQLMGRLQELPASHVAPYAAQDAEVTLHLYEKFVPELKRQSLLPLFDLECRQIPLLIAMRKQGVRIDLDRVRELISDFKYREAKVQQELDDMAGEPFPNTRTAKQIEIIVRVVGAEHFKKSAVGNYLTGKKHIRNLKHPFLEKITELNSIRKLRRDFLENFLKFEVDGRLHPEFHPLKTNAEGGSSLMSTKTGRLSSSHPNIQNIPADGELGHLIRTCFIPEDGCDWFCADYGQQEYRWAAHIAIENKCEGWETVKRMYEENPDLDFHNLGSMLLFGNIDHDNRKKVKTLGFGILYGQGLQGFADALGCTKEEAGTLLEQYKQKVPFVTAAMNMAKRQAEGRGYVTTYLKRRRRYDFFETSEREDTTIVKGRSAAIAKVLDENDPWHNKQLRRYKTYTAINSMCQGSSADQTKMAAVYLYEKYGIVPHIMVHDEFDLSIPKGDELTAKRVIHVMENVIKLHIPVKADGGSGPNWGEAKG